MPQSSETAEKPTTRVFVIGKHTGDSAEFEQAVSEHLFASDLPIERATVDVEHIDDDDGPSGYDAVVTILEPDGGFTEAALHDWAVDAARDIALGN